MIAWVLTLVLATGLFGCNEAERSTPAGPFAGTELVFSVSLAEEEKGALRDLVARFERRTGAHVTLVSITAANLPEKLTVELAAGPPTIHLFAQDNLAIRILLDRQLVDDLSDVDVPVAVPAAMVPEDSHFLPFRPNVRVTYVNKKRFADAGVDVPRTAQELRSTARRLKQAAGGVPKVVLSLAQGDPAAVTISEWVVGFGGDPLVLNDAGSVEAFEFLRTMWAEGLLAPESLIAKYDNVVDLLQGETAWLAQNWPFTSGVLADQGLLERFDVYAGWSGPVRSAHVVGGDLLGIPRGVGERERSASVELARFLMSLEAQEYLMKHNAWPSIRNDAYQQVPPDKEETFGAVRAALQGAWYRPSAARWPAVSEAMNEAVRRVIQNGEPARGVLDELVDRLDG